MPPTKIIIAFLLTILVFLYVANFVVYQALLLALGISGGANPSFLATGTPGIIGALGILAASFIASLFLGMRYYNIFTRVFSILSMVWMGFFGYFFLASVLYIFEFSYIGDPSGFFALFLFGLTAIAGTYGIFHARKLIIKEITVELPNLPEIWRKRKAVWISDLHIGQINAEKYVARVIEKLKKLAPDILFIGGDLVDSPTAKKPLEFILPFRGLSVPQGIFFITGNHEIYGNNVLMLQKIKEAGIRTLRDEKLVLDDLQIIGVDFISTEKEPDFKRILAGLAINPDIPSILLKHEPRYITAAVEAGVSFQISGHTHRGQQWPFEYLTRLVYGRFAYGLQQLGDMQVYTSSGAGTWGPPMRVGTDSEIVVFTFI